MARTTQRCAGCSGRDSPVDGRQLARCRHPPVSRARYRLFCSPLRTAPATMGAGSSGRYVGTLLHEMRIIGPQFVVIGVLFLISLRADKPEREHGTAVLTLAF